MSDSTGLTLENFSGDSEFKNQSISLPVNLTITMGKIMCLPGGRLPSLLLKLLFGLGTIKTGQAVFQDNKQQKIILSDRTSSTEMLQWRSLFGMAFRDYGLLSNMSIFENMALPLRYHGPQSLLDPQLVFDVDERVDELLQELAIPSAVYKLRPHDVSWSDRKKVLIARSIVRDPPVLVMDGPNTMLSYQDNALIAGWITRQKKRRALLINAEDITFGLAIADQLYDVVTCAPISLTNPSEIIPSYLLEQAQCLKRGLNLELTGVK